MNCPICGEPMGFSEASFLGNCIRCDDAPPTTGERLVMAAFIIAAAIIGAALGLLMGASA